MLALSGGSDDLPSDNQETHKMPTSRTRRLLFSGAATIGVVVGAAGLAGAVTGQSPTTSANPQEAEHDQAPSYHSSVTAPAAAERGSESAEDANLQGLATVTADQASAAAVGAVPGTAGKVELENEDGNVVWSVEVTGADGTVTDVKVDAGNRDILAQEVDNESDAGHEAPEGNESDAGNDAPDAGESPNG